MSEDEIQSFGQVIDKSFSSIRMKDMGRAINIYDTWKSVLQKIYSERNPNEGKNMAAHSQVVDLKNGILLVEADHPGWIELLRLHKKFILNGMQKAIKDENIDTLAFRLSGSEKGLASVDTAYSPEQVRKEIAKRIEKEDKVTLLRSAVIFAVSGILYLLLKKVVLALTGLPEAGGYHSLGTILSDLKSVPSRLFVAYGSKFSMFFVRKGMGLGRIGNCLLAGLDMMI